MFSNQLMFIGVNETNFYLIKPLFDRSFMACYFGKKKYKIK